ncbi:hypothetical protein Poli38472_003607 [Pythium oligandrum]|uniref:HIT-type domain-containing protein n=1 Tax=Pythium oligandrum TaxID=41045 RepID=A0A8K1CLS1_PYTOL|nr:hypothetical protein Poli38472_003607 [Pythium oligandrum]|eukprot:TMW65842.1 hypothetical protein Poli38472_003607 [Pythium oligandrum]
MERVPIRLGRLRTTVTDATPSSRVDIQLHDDHSESPVIRVATAARVCRVCSQNEARYTCPRCNMPYCSVVCYRTHGEGCTEQFYQEHVASEIALQERVTVREDPKAQRQREARSMLDRVKEFQDEMAEVTEGLDVDATAERLERLMLMSEGDLSLDCLTEEEQARFLADVAAGRLSKFIVPWEPWWLMAASKYESETSARRRALIQEVEGQGDDQSVLDSDDEENVEEAMVIDTVKFPAAIFTRAIEKTMPTTLDAIVRGPVAPSLVYHLVEILFAYALTMRTFNGDPQQDAEDASLTLLAASDVLNEDARFSSLESVFQNCLEKRSISGAQQAATNALVLSDAVVMLQHRVFVLDALTDAMAIIRAAESDLHHKTPSKKRLSKEERAMSKRLLAVERKLDFFRIWRHHTINHKDLLAVSSSLNTMCESLGRSLDNMIM